MDVESRFSALAFANAASRASGLEECYDLSSCTGMPGVRCPGGYFSGCLGSFHCASVAYHYESPQLCRGYRLPSEAEWEYAARGGESFPFAGSHEPDDVGWTSQEGIQKPMAVCTKVPNAIGLCDMTGNLAEITHGVSDYATLPEIDPPISSIDYFYPDVFRGGGFHLRWWESANARRGNSWTGTFVADEGAGPTHNVIGVRLVRTHHVD
jgi:hypothetical protein